MNKILPLHVSIWSPKSPSKRKRKISDPVQSDKSPYTDRKIKKTNVTTQKRNHKNFDYTTIADRFRTVSWGNDSHPTGVVKLFWIRGTSLNHWYFFSLHALWKTMKKDSRLKYSENVRMCEYQYTSDEFMSCLISFHLAGRLVRYKWNQACHSCEVYRCIENDYLKEKWGRY